MLAMLYQWQYVAIKKISTGNLKRHSDTSPCLITSDKPFEHKVYVSNCPKPKALAI